MYLLPFPKQSGDNQTIQDSSWVLDGNLLGCIFILNQDSIKLCLFCMWWKLKEIQAFKLFTSVDNLCKLKCMETFLLYESMNKSYKNILQGTFGYLIWFFFSLSVIELSLGELCSVLFFIARLTSQTKLIIPQLSQEPWRRESDKL